MSALNIGRFSIENEIWTVAIRKRNGSLLYQGNGEGFVSIPKNERYWMADPFLFKYYARNYLFVEMYDRKKKKGVIGVSRIKDGKCGKFHVCLELPFHLSYPCIFQKDGEVFMLPECAESGKVTVYRSTSFPKKWEPAYDLCVDQCVDTTPFFNSWTQEEQFFTSRYDAAEGGNDNLCLINCNRQTIPLFSRNRCVRSAGNIIYDSDIIRPAQDDTKTYGCGLFFYRIKNARKDLYSEEKMLRVCTRGNKINEDDLEVDVEGDKNYIGIHTYNFNEDYEVIDLLIEKQRNVFVLWNNRNKVLKQLCKKINRKFIE